MATGIAQFQGRTTGFSIQKSIASRNRLRTRNKILTEKLDILAICANSSRNLASQAVLRDKLTATITAHSSAWARPILSTWSVGFSIALRCGQSGVAWWNEVIDRHSGERELNPWVFADDSDFYLVDGADRE